MPQARPSQVFALHALFFAGLVLVALFVCFWNLGATSIAFDDESIHVRVVQEMVEAGRWIFPTVDGEPYLGKPPFKLALSKLIVLLFGDSNLSFRILDGLAGFGTILLTFLLALRLFDSLAIAYTAALLLCVNRVFLFKHIVRSAVQDSMLVFLSTAALLVAWELLCIVKRAQVDTERRRCSVLAVGIGMLTSCAIWTKSIAGFFPLVIFYPVLGATCGVHELFRTGRRLLLAPLLIATCSAALYFGLNVLFVPGSMYQTMEMNIYNRLLGAGFHNVERWDLYVELLFQRGSVAPVGLLILGLIIAAAGCLRREPRYLFLMAWVVIPVLGFSALSSRLEWYIAPAFPAIALLSAAGFWLTISRLIKIALVTPGLLPRLAVALVILTISGYGARSLYRASSYAIKRILRENKPRAIELICRAIRQEIQASPSPGTVALFQLQSALDKKNAPFNLHEKVYLGMLSPYSVTVESEAELLALKHSGDLAFIFAPAVQAKRLSALLSPCAESTLRGRRYRDTVEQQGWPSMVVLAFRSCTRAQGRW